MAKRLTQRETAVLEAILDAMPRGGTGSDLVSGVRTRLGSIAVGDVTPAGIHRTAASLCSKNLAWRAGTSKLQWYKITQWGREVLDGKSDRYRKAGER